MRLKILFLSASADRPGNQKTHLLDRRSGKSRQMMKSAEVRLMVWSKGGLECKWEVEKCSMVAESSEKVYCVPCCAERGGK